MKTSKIQNERPADSYSRFSSGKTTGKQFDGDSESRQTEAFEEFCADFELTPRNTMFDKGYSGFKGEHRSKGHFGRYLALVKAGQIEKGTVLVIENWDRFSRERIDISFQTCCEILSAGVDIGVYDLHDIFTESDIDSGKINQVYNELQRARRESLRKQKLTKRNWINRRQRKTKNCPSWLTVVNGEWDFNDTAKIIKRAVQLAIDGHGKQSIQRTLKIKMNGIDGILRSRTLIGEYRPCERAANGPIKKDRKISGEVIPNYYPALITENEFNRLQLAIDSRTHKKGRKGKNGIDTNLFTNMIFNQTGEKMVVKRTVRDTVYLVPSCLKGASVRYDVLEKAVLKYLSELQSSDLEPEDNDTQLRIDSLRGSLATITANLDQLTREIQESPSKAILTAIRSLETRQEACQKEMEILKRQQTKGTTAEQLEETKNVIAILEKKPELRTKAKSLISGIIEQIKICIRSPKYFDIAIKLRESDCKGKYIRIKEDQSTVCYSAY